MVSRPLSLPFSFDTDTASANTSRCHREATLGSRGDPFDYKIAAGFALAM